MTYIFFLQVLSNTVATALRLTGKDEVEETAQFVTMFDRLFDCLNVADFDSGRHSRNPFKAPYRSGDDFRLKVRSYILLNIYVHEEQYSISHLVVCPLVVAGRGVPPIS